MTVAAIKEAIAQLPEVDRHLLAAWLNEFDYDDWDRQMVADFSPGGRGTALIENIRREINCGGGVPFEEALGQVEAERNQRRR